MQSRIVAARLTREKAGKRDVSGENEAEFFAVASEQVFEAPAALRQHLPEVYRQLEQFYRQHPY